MDTDSILVLGIVLGAISVPSILAAIADGRMPKFGFAATVLSLSLIGWAVFSKPGGYSFDAVMNAFVQVGASILN